ncbi:MAG: hypothetical protein VKP62_13190 [Candidatus Sericytochromatia bacterium]|nr:hypothetical protein [Candidatus Sericytochromatia bacterium]
MGARLTAIAWLTCASLPLGGPALAEREAPELKPRAKAASEAPETKPRAKAVTLEPFAEGPQGNWHYALSTLPLRVTLVRFDPAGVRLDSLPQGQRWWVHQLAYNQRTETGKGARELNLALNWAQAAHTTMLGAELGGRSGSAHGLYLGHGLQLNLYRQPTVQAGDGRVRVDQAWDAGLGYWGAFGLRAIRGPLGWFAEAGWLWQSGLTPLAGLAGGTRVNELQAESGPIARAGFTIRI